MDYGSFRRYGFVYSIAGALLALMISSVANGQVTLTQPAQSATVSGVTNVTIGTAGYVSWSNFYVDGQYQASTPPSTWSWNTAAFANGGHTVSVNAFSSNGQWLGNASIYVYVRNTGGTPSSGGGSSAGWQVTPGATISGLTGSASRISWADSNPANYGNYWVWGDGYPLMGGPLLNDWQAASFVKATQKSAVEYGPNGWANAVDNNYFNYIASTNPGNYQYQLGGFYAAYAGSPWQAEVDRVDGACPIANPTTAEVIQWAGNKWGINPILLYAEVTNESSWNQAGIGDNGLSSGLFQIADRNSWAAPNHAFPGFGGSGSMLARENSCFNADYFGAWLFSAFQGIVGSPGGDPGAALQSWYSNYAYSAGSYAYETYSLLTNQDWIPWDFFGARVPY